MYLSLSPQVYSGFIYTRKIKIHCLYSCCPKYSVEKSVPYSLPSKRRGDVYPVCRHSRRTSVVLLSKNLTSPVSNGMLIVRGRQREDSCITSRCKCSPCTAITLYLSRGPVMHLLPALSLSQF